jgi:glucosamine-6-phosphate deaminase
MDIIKVKNYKELSEKASEILIDKILEKPNITIGFATGATPKGLYKKLVKAYKKKEIDFSKVKSFNLDEYYPIKKTDTKSYHSYLFNNLFNHVNIKKNNITLLNGETKNSEKECKNYEAKIKKNPIDVQILGVGVNGHIAFNEPGSSLNSKTRLAELTNHKKVLTMGISTIMSAKKLILLASGKSKSKAIKCLLENNVNKNSPVSFLKRHKNLTVIIDSKAGCLLKNLNKMANEEILDKGYEKAKEVIKKCSTKYGLYASGGKDGYKGVWARDSIISLIGASTEKDPLIKEQFKKSLIVLAKYQSEKGQISNAVLHFERKKPQVDYLTIDSSLWFIIGHYIYKKRYGKELFTKYKKSITKAITWLSYQDMGEDIMLEQLPTTDWQDAFPHKYGRTINTQALYYLVLNLIGEKKKAGQLKNAVNKKDDYELWNGNFYYAYRWKNHNKYKEIGEWFDSLGNLLSIIFDLADNTKAKKILSYIKKNKINNPYPVKSIYPPIRKGEKDWQDYYLDCDAGKPYHYLNGGIWPYIGGFYVLALIKVKKFKEAKKELLKLAESNLKGNLFPEWINPQTKESHGKLQAWDAGMYIMAYQSLKKKKILL